MTESSLAPSTLVHVVAACARGGAATDTATVIRVERPSRRARAMPSGALHVDVAERVHGG